MAELDPLTNLPATDPVSETTKRRESILSKGRSSSSSSPDASDFLRMDRNMRPQRVHGAFGDYDNVNVTRDRNFNEIRAQNQGVLELAGKGIVQGVGSFAGMLVEGVGALRDVPRDLVNKAMGKENQFERNIVSQTGKDIQEWVREIAPIYQTEIAQSNKLARFADASFIFSHAPTITSALSFLIPSLVVAKGASILTKLAGGGQAAQRLMGVVGASITGREMEAEMESQEMYEQRLKEFKDQGYSPAEAKEKAARDATGVYNASYSNLAFDIPSWALGLRGVNLANRALRKSVVDLAESSQQPLLQAVRQNLIKNPALTTKKAVEKAGFKSWADFVGQAGLEGLEEFNIEIQKERVLNNSRILSGESEGDVHNVIGTYLSGDFTQYLDNPEILNATVFGAIGGALFGGFHRYASMKENRKNIEFEVKQADLLNQQAQHTQERLNKVKSYIAQGDEISANEELKFLVSDLAIKGISSEKGLIPGAVNTGNLDNIREMFAGVAELTDAEAEQLDLGVESKEQARKALEEIDKIEQIYDKNSTKVHGTNIDDILNLYLSEQEYVNNVTEESITEYDSRLAELYSDPAIRSLTEELNAGQQEYMGKVQELNDLKQEKKTLEATHLPQAIGNRLRMKISSNVRKRSLEDIDNRINQLQEDIDASKGEDGLTKKQVSQAERVRKELAKNSDVRDLERFKIHKEYQLREGQQTLGELLKTDNQEDIARSIDAKDEEIERQVNEFIIDESIGERGTVKIGDTPYLLEKTDDGYTIQEVDRQLNIVEGKQPKKISDLGEFIDTAEIYNPEYMYSPEEFEALTKSINSNLRDKKFSDAINILNDQVYKSNYADKSREIAESIQSGINEYINKETSIAKLKEFANDINAYLNRKDIRDSLGNAIRQKIADIRKENQAQIEAFNEMFQKTNEEASRLLDQKERVEERINELNDIVEVQMQEVRDLANKKNRTQKSILETHWAVRRRLNEAKEQVNDELSELRSLRSKLNKQLKEINKDLDVYQRLKNRLKDTEEIPGLVIEEKLLSAESEVNAIRASTLVEFNLTDYGLNKLKEHYENGVQDVDVAMRAVSKLRDIVISMFEGNEIAIKAAEDSFQQMIDEGTFSDENALLSEAMFDRYRNLYTKNLTEGLRKQDPEMSQDKKYRLIQAVGAMRIGTEGTWKNMVERARKELNEEYDEYEANLDRLKELKNIIPVYQDVLQAMRDALKAFRYSSKGKKEDKDPPGETGSTLQAPKRLPEHVFTRLAGSQGDTFNGMSSDPSQRRYARFVSNTDIASEAENLQIEIVRPKDIGIDIGTLPDHYDEKDVLYAIVQDKEGNYLTEDGVTEVFDPNTAIYTSVPLASYNSNRMSKTYAIDEDGQIVATEKEVMRVFPNDEVEVAIEKYREWIDNLKDEHEQFLKQVHAELDAGNKVIRDIYGKSNGVPNLSDADSNPKSLKERFNKEDFDEGKLSLEVMTTPTKEIGGEVYTVQPGSVLVIDNENGNYSPTENRGLKKEEIDTIIESLRYMTQNSRRSGNKIFTEVPLKDSEGNNLQKEVKGEISNVFFTDVLKSLIYYGSDKGSIKLAKTNIPGGALTIEFEDSVETIDIFAERDGKKMLNLNPYLEKRLRDRLSNMIHNVESKDMRGGHNKYSYSDGAFSKTEYKQYLDYILDEDVLSTRLREPGKVTVVEGGVEVKEDGITHLNQNLYYDNSIAEEQAPWEEPSEPSVEGAPDIDKVLDEIDKIEQPSQEPTIVEEPSESDLESAPDLDQSSEQSTSEEVSQKLKDLGDIDDIVDFQRESQVGALSPSEVQSITKNLSDRTGIPFNILSEERGLDVLRQLKKDGRIDEEFTIENMPKGMYDRGVSYIFTKGEVSADTPFHEIAHPIVNQIIADNPALYDRLINEIKSSPAGRGIINRVLKSYPNAVIGEEISPHAWAEIITTAIGEDAAGKYSGRANSSLINAIKNVWEKIKQFFRDVFGDVVQVDQLSADTTIGDIAELLALTEQKFLLTPSVITQYQRVDTSKNLLPGKNSKFTREALEAFNYFFFRTLLSKNTNKLPLLLSGQETNKGFYKQLLDDVWTNFKKAPRGLAKVSGRVKKGTPEYTRLITQILNYKYVLENWNDVVRLHSQYLGRYNIEVVNDDTYSQENTKDANEQWVSDSLRFSAKQNATSNIRLLIGAMKSGNIVKNESFRTTDNAEFGKLFNLLANTLSNKSDLKEMQTALQDLKGEEGVKYLLDLIINKIDDIETLTQADAQLLLEFRRTFSKHYNDYSVLYTNAEGGFDMKDANVNTAKNRLVDKWRKNVDPRYENFKNKGNTVVYDIKTMRKKGKIGVPELRKNNRYLPEGKMSNIRREYMRSVNFLKEIGIEVGSETIAGSEFNERVDYIYKYIYNGGEIDVLSNYSDYKEDIFKSIAAHEVNNSHNAIENSHFRAGETIYNVNLYSYMTQSSDKINKLSNISDLGSQLPHLIDPYTRNSLLFNRTGKRDKRYNRLFDQDGNRTTEELKIIFIDEFINESSREREVFSNLSKKDQTLITFNAALQGSYPVFRAGDNSIERHIPMGEFFSSTDIRDGEYLPVFHDYLVDEISSIIELRNSDNKYNEVTNIGIDELIQKYPIANIFYGNTALKGAMKEAIESGDTSALFAGNNTQKINTALINYFNNEVKNTKRYLLENNIIEKDGKQFKNRGLSGITTNASSTIRNDILNSIIGKAIVNRFTANVEQTKLFTGPLVFYNNPDNLFKRMSGTVGTKNMLAVGHEENQILNKFRPRKSNAPKRLYKTATDGVLSEAITEYKEGAKPILRSAMFQDPKVRSSYLDALPKDIAKDAYQSMDEADAVGMISLDGYRDMHNRAGSWNMYLERLYQWETRPDKSKGIKFTNWYTGAVENIVAPSQLINPDGKRTVFNMMKPHYFGPLAEQGYIPGMYKTAFIPILPSYADRPAMQELLTYQRERNVDLVTFPSSNKVGTKTDADGNIPSLYNDEGTPNLSEGLIQDTYMEYWGIQLDTGTSVKEDVVKGTQLMKMIFSNIYENGEAVNSELSEKAEELTRVNNALIQKGLNELIDELDLELKDGNYTPKSIERLVAFLEDEARGRDANNNVLDSLSYLSEYWEDSNLGFDVMSNRDKIENILASIADSRVISQKMPGGAKVQTPSTFFENGKRRYSNDKAHLASNELKFYEEEGVMEVYLPHHFKEVYEGLTVDEVDEMLRKGIGFRIPTSGMNSIEHIKVVGYLPQSAGETIVVPSEIVAKAGSDFDVDKLNVFLPNYKMVNGSPEYISYDADKSMSENSRQQLENRMIELMGEIISHPDNRSQLLESIGTDLIEAQEANIIKKLGLDTSRKTMTDAAGNFPYYMEVTKRNNESKQLTGIAALHSSDHIHSMRYGYKLSSKNHEIHLPHNTDESGNISLGGQTTTDGEKITSLLNQLLNTAVDGVKKPIFYNLNTNLETSNVIFYLIRAGVSAKNTFEFVNEPIIREYTKLEQIRKSVSDSKATRKENKTTAKNKFKGKGKILDQYLAYEESGQVLNSYMQATRIDTQAMGKNTSELDLIMYNADRVVNKKSGIINADKLLTKGGSRVIEPLGEIEEFYEGDITPEEDTVFVFGSNPEGRHGAGAAKVAREQFGAVYGQGEGLQGNAYALPTKNIRKVTKPKGTINVYWGQAESETSTKILSNLAPRKFTWKGREYGSVEHAYQSNKSGTFDESTYNAYNKIGGYGKKIRGKGTVAEMKAADSLGLMKKLVVESFIQNPNSEATKKLLQYENFTHNTNQLIDKAFLEGLKLAQKQLTTTGSKSISPEQITESIKKLYEVAKQNPNKQFKVAYRNTTDTSLNGYTGLEMIEMFNQAGAIPSNIVFSKEWIDTGAFESVERAPLKPVSKYESDGFMAVHYNALKSFDKMFNSFFVTKRSEKSKAIYDRMLKYISPKLMAIDKKVKILDKVKSDIINQVVLNNQFLINDRIQQPISEQLDLIIGDNTVAKRLAEYQDKSDNIFIEALQPIIGKEKYDLYGERTFVDTVKLYDQRMDSVEVNSMIDAYRELFDTDDGKDLAIDLAKLAFMQGGLQLTPMAYTKLIPAEFYIEMIDTAFKNQSATMSENTFLRNFILSNYNDNDIIPTWFGGRQPSGWIYKRFNKLNLTDEQIAERKKLNQPIVSNIPEIVINRIEDEKAMGLFQGLEGFGNQITVIPNAIRDNKNNVNLLYYGSDLRIKKEGHKSVQVGDKTTSTERANQIKKLCRT